MMEVETVRLLMLINTTGWLSSWKNPSNNTPLSQRLAAMEKEQSLGPFVTQGRGKRMSSPPVEQIQLSNKFAPLGIKRTKTDVVVDEYCTTDDDDEDPENTFQVNKTPGGPISTKNNNTAPIIATQRTIAKTVAQPKN